MTTSSDLAPTTRVTILKHLAAGKGLDVVATIVGLKRDQVLDVASHHGYPDRDKLAWAVDVLVQKIENERSTLPDRTHEARRDERRVAIAEQPATVPSPASLTKPDEIRVLLNTAKSHDSKRIQRAADKVIDDLDRLRTMLREDQEKHAARRKAEAEKAAARAEVERLEAQLAAAKAKLRGKPAAPKPGSSPYAGPKPTGEYPCRNDGCDQVISTPQGRGLHERQHCEHRAQAAS